MLEFTLSVIQLPPYYYRIENWRSGTWVSSGWQFSWAAHFARVSGCTGQTCPSKTCLRFCTATHTSPGPPRPILPSENQQICNRGPIYFLLTYEESYCRTFESLEFCFWWGWRHIKFVISAFSKNWAGLLILVNVLISRLFQFVCFVIMVASLAKT